MAETKMLASGFGGQGILLLAEIIVTAAIAEDKHGTTISSYGAEARGGTCNCQFIVSDDAIVDPFIKSPDVLIAMNQVSLDKFEKTVGAGGTVLYDDSIIARKGDRSDITLVPVPATRIATDLGSRRSANMVMLGAFVKNTQKIKKETAVAVLKEMFSGEKEKSLDENIRAFEAGFEYNI